jgi:hypothetical protein
VIDLVSQYRVPINLLLVFILACFVLLRVISLVRKQVSDAAAGHSEAPAPQHPLLNAVDAAAAIGIGSAWTALFYTGPSLAELWQGQGSAAHWMVVLLYTWLWLSVRPPVPAKGTAAVLTSIVVRTGLYGLFFIVVIATLNNW